MRPTAIAMPSHIADGEPDVSWFIDHSDNAIVVCDDTARVTWTNQGFTRMFGYTREDAVGRPPSDFLAGPPTDPDTVEWVGGQLHAQQGYRTDLLGYAKNDVPLWISAVVNPVYDPERNVRYLLGVYTDITHSGLLYTARCV